jgi:hypothetical protein
MVKMVRFTRWLLGKKWGRGDSGTGVDMERGLVVQNMSGKLAGRLHEMEEQLEIMLDVA